VYDELTRLAEEQGNLVDIGLLQEDAHREGTAVVQDGLPRLLRRRPTRPRGARRDLYTHVKAEDAAEILQATTEGRVVERLVLPRPVSGDAYERPEGSPF
jgi:(2Fe-2S) ferredoxin